MSNGPRVCRQGQRPRPWVFEAFWVFDWPCHLAFPLESKRCTSRRRGHGRAKLSEPPPHEPYQPPGTEPAWERDTLPDTDMAGRQARATTNRRWGGNKPTSADGDPSWSAETAASRALYGERAPRTVAACRANPAQAPRRSTPTACARAGSAASTVAGGGRDGARPRSPHVVRRPVGHRRDPDARRRAGHRPVVRHLPAAVGDQYPLVLDLVVRGDDARLRRGVRQRMRPAAVPAPAQRQRRPAVSQPERRDRICQVK